MDKSMRRVRLINGFEFNYATDFREDQSTLLLYTVLWTTVLMTSFNAAGNGEDTKNELDPVGHADTGEEPAQMCPHRGNLDAHGLSNLFVLLALEDKGDDAGLLGGQVKSMDDGLPFLGP